MLIYPLVALLLFGAWVEFDGEFPDEAEYCPLDSI
jgi:hypothetical protein